MRIGVVSNTDYYLWNFRRGFLGTLRERGHEVFAISPPGEYVERLKGLGVSHIPIQMDRGGTNPLKDMVFFFRLYRILKSQKFDLVHTFTIKPNIYGAWACRLARVPAKVASVTGMGYIFSNGRCLKARAMRGVVNLLYRFSFGFNDYVIFQNEEDMGYFLSKGFLASKKAKLIRGSGVNLREYSPGAIDGASIERLRRELAIGDNGVVITMACRLIWEKGVKEFIEAAKTVKDRFPGTVFLLAGGVDNGNPSAVPEGHLREAEAEGNFKWLGHWDDMPGLLAVSDIVVLPTYYREGVPRVLLEAMAMGKPVVTTRLAGCRETVEEGKNGFLVPERDAAALAQAIERLVADRHLRASYGRHGRLKAEREFDEKSIALQTIRLYEDSLCRGEKHP